MTKENGQPKPENTKKRKTRIWNRLIIIGLGIIAGMGLVIVDVSRAVSYLSDEPEACVNCHVMNTQYATWQHSSHYNVATCNDCHVPHDNFISKYLFKARDGMQHSYMFMFRLEPQVIRLDKDAEGVIQQNCESCHSHAMQTVTAMEGITTDEKLCWDCHREVPHGTVRSLSTTPEPMRPRLPKPGYGMKNLTIGTRQPRAEENKNEQE